MKKAIAAAVVLLASIAAWTMQSNKSITLTWDPIQAETAPVANSTEIRLYDISVTPAVLLGTAPCAVAPWSCPTSLTITVAKRRYDIVARAWNGEWESLDSNVVIQPGPPKAPVNVRK